ncbi:hypothetical protein [Micromonospora zamorensis]|uniref:hypothetical protein n=1 Tax=Micromonospora zamorensis TaxID=709883 RepID=UPI00378930E8
MIATATTLLFAGTPAQAEPTTPTAPVSSGANAFAPLATCYGGAVRSYFENLRYEYEPLIAYHAF